MDAGGTMGDPDVVVHAEWSTRLHCTLATPARWSEAKAQQWYAAQPWLVGANFIPADAINQLEMWQADSFDPQEIDKELGWAEGLGMNTMRVFLHDRSVAAGCAGVPEAHRYLSHHCGEAPHQADVCAVRFLLGSGVQAGTAAAADSGRAQLRLGAEPGREGAGRFGGVSAVEDVCAGRGRSIRK